MGSSLFSSLFWLGTMAGSGLGAAVFGAGAMIVCSRIIGGLEARKPPEIATDPPPSAHSPFSTGKAATLGR
jgi:hypothetical protein